MEGKRKADKEEYNAGANPIDKKIRGQCTGPPSWPGRVTSMIKKKKLEA